MEPAQAAGLRNVRVVDEGTAFPQRVAMFAPCDVRIPKRRTNVDQSGTGINIPEKRERVDFFAVQQGTNDGNRSLLRCSMRFVSNETKTDSTLSSHAFSRQMRRDGFARIRSRWAAAGTAQIFNEGGKAEMAIRPIFFCGVVAGFGADRPAVQTARSRDGWQRPRSHQHHQHAGQDAEMPRCRDACSYPAHEKAPAFAEARGKDDQRTRPAHAGRGVGPPKRIRT